MLEKEEAQAKLANLPSGLGSVRREQTERRTKTGKKVSLIEIYYYTFK